jgi:hemolysin activation/secretion protein
MAMWSIAQMKIRSLLVAISGISAIVTISLPLRAQTPTDPNNPFPQFTPIAQILPPQPSITSSCNNEISDPRKSVVVSKVRVLDSADREISRSDWAQITQPAIGKTISIGELSKIADRLTQTYLDRGEITSRVILCKTTEGLITFYSIEGSLERVNITGLVKLDPNYVRSRLALATDTPVNANKLEDQLRLLRADPLFSNVEASLQAGSGIGKSILNVRVTEANPLRIDVTTDNYSSPSVGGERIGTSIDYRNIVGQGDSASLAYNHALSSGTDFFDFTYKIPVNPMQGTLQARIAPSSNQITIPPFQDSGYRGRSQFYELSYRQPLIRNPREEFALSWGLALQTGETFIGNTPTQLSFGADGQGVSKATVLKFGQDYVSRDPNGAWGAKSLLNFGVGIFGATINPQPTPDGRFFSWQGQLQRSQVLDSNQLLVAQLDAQLASKPLLSIEQFAIGGGQSVRGFRQNVRSADNGVRLSVENRITIQRDAAGTQTLALAPFLDTGLVWNQANNPDTQFPSQNFLAGIGLGVIWQPTSQWNVRVDYGLPLVNLQDRGTNIQDSGFYFSVNYKL